MAVLLPAGRQSFITAAGLPLVGGKIYTYAAGTNTPQPTYSDAAGTVPNTNPVILDARGEALVFWSGAYKVVLRDALDNLIWSVDNVQATSSDPNLRGDLTASGGSDVIGYTQGGAGSIVTTLQEVARRSIHIRDFGARPNNTAAVNNAAIQAAINYAVSAGFALNFGDSGTYQITGLTVNNVSNGFTMYGRGATLAMQNVAAAINIINSSDVVIDGLWLTGTTSTAVDNAQIGILASTVSYVRVRNCRILNFSKGIFTANSAQGYPLSGNFQLPSQASGNLIRACWVGVWTQDGAPPNAGEYWRFFDNTITDCTRSGIFCNAGNCAIIGNTVNGNNVGIWLFGGPASVNGDHGICSLNTINHNARAGLYVDTPLRSWTIVGNNIWAALGGTSGALTLGQAAGVSDGTMNFAFGVYLRNCHDVVFTSNVIGRNQFNMGVFNCINTIIAHNDFQTDPASTVAQFNVFNTPGITFNKLGPNIFTGSWTGLVAYPYDGDPNRPHNVGAAQQPGVNAVMEPPFLNGWVNFGNGDDAQFYKDSNNTVFLRGYIKTGTIGLSAFQLPIGYRPRDAGRNFAVASNNLFGIVQVGVDGNVIPIAPSSNVGVSLDGISFLAA